jgi:hypothetical protein
LAASIAQASSVTTGQSREEVITTLGEPMGTIELREKTLLLYPQGEITLKADQVTEIDLMTQAEFEADQQRLQAEREEWLATQEKLAAARTEEGKTIRAEKMASSTFAAQPPKDKLDYWRSFQARYPEVDVSAPIAEALNSYESELESLLQQQRIADLEARVAQAEKEAVTARLEAEKLREDKELNESERNYGLRYYTDPVITTNRYYYRPPTVTIYTSGNSNRVTHPKHDKAREYDQSKNPKKPRKQTIYRKTDKDGPTESVAERVARILQEARNR